MKLFSYLNGLMPRIVDASPAMAQTTIAFNINLDSWDWYPYSTATSPSESLPVLGPNKPLLVLLFLSTAFNKHLISS